MGESYHPGSTQIVRLTSEERSKYAHEIREKVEEHKLTYVWLVNRLADEGIFTDKYEMSSVLVGTRTGPKVDEILRESMTILDDYECHLKSVKGT